MALTNAERQARYREKRKLGSTTERELKTFVSYDTWTKLSGLANGYGVTKKEIIETLVSTEYEKVVGSLKPNTPEWDAFFAK